MRLASSETSPGEPSVAPRRDELLSAIDHLVSRAATHDQKFALLVLNLLEFREFNIHFGHQQGDFLLREVVRCIQEVLRPDDRVFHIGGDEFAVLLSDLKAVQVVPLAMERILDAVESGKYLAEGIPAVSLRAGGAIFPDHAGSRDELLCAADNALYAARKSRRRYSIYDSSLHAQNQQRIQMRKDLAASLEKDRLLFHYQPQIDLREKRIKGCEALIRWPHETQGWINPEIFIAAAEESALIEDLTFWSLNVVLREWAQLAENMPGNSIAINLSATLLNSREIVDMVERALNIWNLPPASLTLEVTESAMMSDPQAALDTLNALNELHINLSIDDFGTGYSSLAYMKHLPTRELKIDKSFVMNMMNNPKDQSIVQSVIDLAHNLNMQVVAEGIENQATLDLLVDMGCDTGQGYFISRPLPLEGAKAFLNGFPYGAVDKS